MNNKPYEELLPCQFCGGKGQFDGLNHFIHHKTYCYLYIEAQPSPPNVNEVAEKCAWDIIEVYGQAHLSPVRLEKYTELVKQSLLTHSAALQKELEETKHQLQYCSQPLYKQNELQLPYWIEVDGTKFNQISIRALQSEITELRKDKERLDWFETCDTEYPNWVD